MVMVDSVGATGKASSYGYTIKGDGKEYPTMGAIPNTADKITSKKIDANTYEAKFTKAGKQVETTTFAVSNGGKTLTIHAKGVSPAGEFENMHGLEQAVRAPFSTRRDQRRRYWEQKFGFFQFAAKGLSVAA